MGYLFGNNLRKLREEKNLSQKDIAEHFKVTNTAVHSWETGRTEPSIDKIVELAKFFNVSVDHLLGFDISKIDKFEKMKVLFKEAGMWDYDNDDLSHEAYERFLELFEVIRKMKDTNN